MSLFIDVHALQTLPPNNINRDDTGAPKAATFGGVPRQRVSSQAWKKAIREDFKTYLTPDQLGTRTKRVVGKITQRVLELAEAQNVEEPWTEDSAAQAVEQLFSKTKIKLTKLTKKELEELEEGTSGLPETSYLLFLSNAQITNVAQAVLDNTDGNWNKRDADNLLDNNHSIDVAMFGRMVADNAAYNVDAAVQVAHAIGVSASEPEFDFFTAVDDEVQAAEETGAGMIGTVQMMSSTLYRYATVNVEELARNLGSDEAAIEASEAFLKSFITSLPSGKQNTFAHNTLPELVVVSLRDDRPISWVTAFEEPVPEDSEGGRRAEATRRLANEAKSFEAMYDAPAKRTWVLSTASLQTAALELGEITNRTEMLRELKDALEPAQ